MKPFYKTFLLLFFIVFLWGFNSFSQQAPGIEWQNTIGGSSYDGLTNAIQTSDGGYILGGVSESPISGDKTEDTIGWFDYWIIKLDTIGNIQWQNTIGGNSFEGSPTIEQIDDGNYIVGGSSKSNISGDKTEDTIGGFDFWIMKLNPSGNIMWQNTIGGDGDDVLTSIMQTTDRGFIVGGYSTSNISGDKTENCLGGQYGDYWIVKIDSLGNIQWQNTIGGNNSDWLASVNQTSDGGYIAGGSSVSDISGDKTENSLGSDDYWVVKIDSIGNIQWQNTIGGNYIDDLKKVQQTTDGGYILGGRSGSGISGDKTENNIGANDLWIIKLNSSGNIQWQNTIGGNSQDYFEDIQQTNDGGFIVGSESNSDISGDKTENSLGFRDYWILKIDSIGNILWQNTIGGSDYDWLSSVQQTNDGGFILGGSSASPISGDKTENSMGPQDYWIVKLFPDTTTSISTLQPPTSSFQISPNPSSGIFQITFPSSSNQKTKYTLEVISTLGQTVFAKQLETLNSKLQTNLDLSFLPKGIYVLIINDGVSVLSSKFVIE